MLNYNIQSSPKDPFNLRLRIFTPEASFLGSFLGIISYAMFAQKKLVSGAITLALCLLAQSYLAIAIIIAIYIIKKIEWIVYLAIPVMIGLIYNEIINQNIDFFINNSGLIRLGGILVFNQIQTSEILLGIGLGNSDLMLVEILKIGIFDRLPSFLFGYIADIGLLGFAAYSYMIAGNRKDFLILILLLLNFPPLFPIIPILLSIVRTPALNGAK